MLQKKLSLQNNKKYTTTYKGAEGYMAPEVIEGKYTVLADIYSLGMVLLQLYKWYDKVDYKIEDLIRGMICFNPEKRWNINKIIRYIYKLQL
jgi:serine/threonine protein kinase